MEDIITMAEHRAHVALGIPHLVTHYGPQWFNKINPETLNILSPRLCVLGQLAGSYTKGLHKLRGITEDGCEDFNLGVCQAWATAHGFLTEIDECSRLKLVWLTAIAAAMVGVDVTGALGVTS